MGYKNLVDFKGKSNAQIMNAIRNTASNPYQERIPAATKANMDEAIRRLLDHRPSRNEFMDALVNQIGLIVVRSNSWDNPLGKFKLGMLDFGDTIEEVMVGLVKAYEYDPNRDALEDQLFAQERVEAQSSFHKINRQNVYKVTVNQAMLRRAFTNADSGLSDLVAQIMAAPTKSDNWDEFNLMADLFRQYEKSDGFFKVNVPDVSAQGSTEADAKFALRRVRELASTLPFLSRHYNAAHMPVSTTADDLELFVTPEFNAAVDVEALAAAFNVDRASIPSRQTIIPRESFGIPGVQAILTTKDFFVVADTLFETAQQPNPAGLYDNYFLHHHQIISVSRFVQAVMFTTEPGTVIEIIDTPVESVEPIVVTDRNGVVQTETLARGNVYDVASSAVTEPEGGLNDAVRFTLTGQQSPLTALSQNGTLFVGFDEKSDALLITATATEDDTEKVTKGFQLTGEIAQLWPSPQVVADPPNTP